MRIQLFSSAVFATAALAAPRGLGKKDRIVGRGLTYNDNGTVIMCTETDWKGECIALEVPLAYDSCVTLSAPFAYNMSSFEPIPGVNCWMQRTTDCTDGCRSPSGCNEIIGFPGYTDLSTYGPWNNTVGSMFCNPDFNYNQPGTKL